jgi:hypothetical protein
MKSRVSVCRVEVAVPGRCRLEEEVDTKSSLLFYYQCCGSGSGSRRGKMTHKNRKKLIIFIFDKVLDVLY